MEILKLLGGRAFTIYAIGTEEQCEVRDFLDELESEAPACYKRLFVLLRRSAEYGPPCNDQQCHKFGDGRFGKLFEFKTPGGARVIWFYDRNRSIICAHAFNKRGQKVAPKHLEKAETIRQKYCSGGRR